MSIVGTLLGKFKIDYDNLQQHELYGAFFGMIQNSQQHVISCGSCVVR